VLGKAAAEELAVPGREVRVRRVVLAVVDVVAGCT